VQSISMEAKMMALQVANWSRFEPSDSRKCKSMQWVAVPINHNGLGYLEVMSHPDGIRMIGGWLLILQVAAQCPKRGLLVADSGRILGAHEIALKTRAQEKDIKSCIALLLENGWLEEVESSGQHPDNIRTTSGLQDRTVQDRGGHPEAPPAPASPIRTRARDEWKYAEGEPWVRVGRKAGCDIRSSNWELWSGAIARSGGNHADFFAMAESMPPGKRWPEKIEAAMSVPKQNATFGPRYLAWVNTGEGPEPQAHE
jgi:hypothetical protein